MRQKNHYKKCSHYIIGASFDSSICFHYFVLLWYVYDLVFWGISCWGGYRVRADGRAGRGLRLSGKQGSSHIHTYTLYVLFVVYCIWTSMCIFNPGLCLLERCVNSTPFGAPAPHFVWSMIEKHILLELQLPSSLCDFKKKQKKKGEHLFSNTRQVD